MTEMDELTAERAKALMKKLPELRERLEAIPEDDPNIELFADTFEFLADVSDLLLRPSLSPAGVTEEQVEAAARVMAEGLYEGKEAWGEYHAIARAALEAAAKVRSPATNVRLPAVEDGWWQHISTRPTGDELFLAYCPPDPDFPEGRMMIWRGSIFPSSESPDHLQFPATHWRPIPKPPASPADAKGDA